MRRRSILSGVALLGIGLILGTTVFRDDIAHAAGIASGAPVIVTNTSLNPVPVQEQNLDGNGNIKVHEQGTAIVRVANANANPVPVTNVNDGQTPYHFFAGNDADVSNTSGDCYTAQNAVPSGKRFVVETVTIEIEYDSTTNPLIGADFGWTGANTAYNENHAVFLVPVKVAAANGESWYEATQQVRVYEPAGTTPRFCWSVGSSFTGTISWTATAWGYLVNAS
jgi:hypothetical protein